MGPYKGQEQANENDIEGDEEEEQGDQGFAEPNAAVQEEEEYSESKDE